MEFPTSNASSGRLKRILTDKEVEYLCFAGHLAAQDILHPWKARMRRFWHKVRYPKSPVQKPYQIRDLLLGECICGEINARNCPVHQ